MSDDRKGTGTAEEQPADDLSSIIAQAYDDSVEKATEKPSVEDKKEVESDKPTGRDETTGKFKSKGITESVDTTDKPEEKPTEQKTEAPSNWAAGDKETFGKIPKEAQEFVLRRHKEMEADYTRKTQEIADFRREYEPISQMFAPHVEKMRQSGWSPASIVRAWAAVEQRFMDGDGAAALADIARNYKIDLRQVLEKAGIDPGMPKPNGNGATPDFTDLLNPLHKTLNSVVDRVNGWDRQQSERAAAEQGQKLQSMLTTIQIFANEKDKGGELLRPHYSEVEQDMADIATSVRAKGQEPPPLQELYERAVWANPSTRSKLLTAQKQTEEAKQKEEARAKTAAARRAGTSVSGGPGASAPRQGRQERSLRDEIEANLADAEDRA